MLAVEIGRQTFRSRLLASAQQKRNTANSPAIQPKSPLSFDPTNDVISNLYAIQGELTSDVVAYLINDLAEYCRSEFMTNIESEGVEQTNSVGFITRFATGFGFYTMLDDITAKQQVESAPRNYWSFASCERCVIVNARRATPSSNEACHILQGQTKEVQYKVYLHVDYEAYTYSVRETMYLLLSMYVECWPQNLPMINHTTPIILPACNAEDIRNVAQKMVTNYCDNCRNALGKLIEFALLGTTLAIQKLNINGKTLSNIITNYINDNAQFWASLSREWSNFLPHHVDLPNGLVGAPLKRAPRITSHEFPQHLRYLASVFAFNHSRDAKTTFNDEITTADSIETGLLIKTPHKNHCMFYKVLLTSPIKDVDELMKGERPAPYLREANDNTNDIIRLWKEYVFAITRSSGALNNFAARIQGLIETNFRFQDREYLHFLYYRRQEYEQNIDSKLTALFQESYLRYLQAILEREDIPQAVKRSILRITKEGAETQGGNRTVLVVPVLLSGPEGFIAVTLLHIQPPSTDIIRSFLLRELINPLYTDLGFLIWRKNSKSTPRYTHYRMKSNRRLLGTSTDQVLQNLGIYSKQLSEDQITKNWQKLWRAAKPIL